MSFARALARAAERARSEAALVALSADLDLDPERIALPREQCWSFWDTRARRDLPAELCVGVGAARVVSARGPQRFAEARARLAAVFAELVELEGAGVRAFGGLSFEPGALGPFASLGDLRFVIPRWTFCRAGEATRVTLVAAPRELADGERLAAELRALTRTRPRPSPAAGRVVDDGKAGFLEAARTAVARVEARALDKVVVVRRAVLEGCFEPRALLDSLSPEVSATRFGFCDGRVAFVGATPELLVRCDGERVASEAVAGTLARSGDVEELCRSDKDRREHDYVVSAVRLGLEGAKVELEPAAEPTIRSLRHVFHLVTPVGGRLREPRHVLDLVRALHPTPAVLGVPADAARGLLQRVERFERGWFAAPVGHVDARGTGTFVVALRSALLSGGRAWLFAGSGVVRGSVPEAELAETEAKLATILSALRRDAAPEPRLESGP